MYSPLNGSGNIPVRTILKRIGIEDVTVVPEQEYPDGNFPTCPFPNPEIREAMEYGVKLCQKIGADLMLATDPDCDRVGIAVPDQNGGICAHHRERSRRDADGIYLLAAYGDGNDAERSGGGDDHRVDGDCR